MSKLEKAIHEVYHMDKIAGRNQWMNSVHPLVKLLLTVLYIALVVSFDKYDLTGLIGMVIYPIAVFILGELSFKDSIKRLKVVLPLVCAVGLFNPFFDKEPLFEIGRFAFTSGMLSMLTLMIKGILSVLASYLLIAATSIEKICYALRLLHIPSIIVTQILLMYRYISLLLEEADRMTKAYSLRAPGQKGIQFKVWGTFIGQLMLRSVDKSEAVYESMCIRGYKGEFYYHNRQSIKINDIIYLVIWTVILMLFRCVPIVEMAGRIVSIY